jgi:hypothetical protein
MVSRLDVIVKPPINTRPTSPVVPGRVDPIRKPLPAPTPNITLPPRLGRPPTAADLIIKRTFDGLTPDQAEKKIFTALKGPVLAENRALVDGTIKQRVRDMQVALNNVFTPGTPNRQFLDSQTVSASGGGAARTVSRNASTLRFPTSTPSARLRVSYGQNRNDASSGVCTSTTARSSIAGERGAFEFVSGGSVLS